MDRGHYVKFMFHYYLNRHFVYKYAPTYRSKQTNTAFTQMQDDSNLK